MAQILAHMVFLNRSYSKMILYHALWITLYITYFTWSLYPIQITSSILNLNLHLLAYKIELESFPPLLSENSAFLAYVKIIEYMMNNFCFNFKYAMLTIYLEKSIKTNFPSSSINICQLSAIQSMAVHFIYKGKGPVKTMHFLSSTIILNFVNL